MHRRTLALIGTLALAVSVPATAAQASATASTTRTSSTRPGTGPQGALNRLRAAARGSVRVRAASDGTVHFLSSTDGRALLTAPSSSGTPAAAVQHQLDTYGAAFGLDGATSRAVVRQTIRSTTGGSVVRAAQVVDGVPVFGGQIVSSLDSHEGLVSLSAATTPAVQVPAPQVSESVARRAALAVIARDHHLPVSALTITSLGRQLYDPALVHLTDPVGVRPVWEFQVDHAYDVRETVLVGTGRGEIALHYNDAPDFAQNRVICDNAGAATVSDQDAVPLCTSGAARTETSGPSSVADVNHAFDNLGATAQAYSDLDGIDLTSLIGATVGGQKTLMATVRWCYSNEACPYDNAFWDGTQMVFGAGFAGADDIVGHELTHGYVQHTAGLFSFHQAGSINESLADTIGEIVDHRYNPNGPEDNSQWTIGEDLGDPTIERSMKNPTLHHQPDRMTSPLWGADDVSVDNGDVHQNDGVGNKTAYLISQGGTFDGQTITGIDGTDPGLAKTGRLYLETIPRLTSGAQYADLGTTLVSTCDELASAGTGGFTTADCTSVRKAVLATQLASPPANRAAAAAQIAAVCPSGQAGQTVLADDDAATAFGWTLGSLWQRTPDNGSPANARTGTSSLFGWDPDPALYGDPSSSDATSAPFAVPTSGPAYLHFDQDYLYDFTPAQGRTKAAYYDGGQVLVQARNSDGTWTTANGLPWVNGPTKRISSSALPVFGGDSYGYGSSRLDVSTLHGRTVRVVLRTLGDHSVSLVGWWVDNMQLFSCAPTTPPAPHVGASAGVGSAIVSWAAPPIPGGVSQYAVRVRGALFHVAGTTTSITVPKGSTAPNDVEVSATSAYALSGPAGHVRLLATSVYQSVSTTRVRRGRTVLVTAHVYDTASGSRLQERVVLQRRSTSTGAWSNVASATTDRTGAHVFRVTQRKATYYRLLAPGVGPRYGAVTGATLVAVR